MISGNEPLDKSEACHYNAPFVTVFAFGCNEIKFSSFGCLFFV